MRYILLVQLFLSALFAHGGSESHVHFFSSWHIEDFTLLLVSIIFVFMLYKYLQQETN